MAGLIPRQTGAGAGSRWSDLFHLRRKRKQLPRRVRDAIRQQQEYSEVLVGWIQLAVVVAMGALYALAPKTFSDNAQLVPVPWALSAYFLFTVTRLLLAYRRLLGDALLYLSVLVDMGLLLGLIWSFHVQYEQPASFYLKAPTLLYVFIFIALRALRFETRFVVFAGLVAAVGWLLMLAYAISVDPSDSMITRDYIEYMTDNKVLLGAEFDKVISILVVTSILALAITRARNLLTDAVVEGATARGLSRFVPASIAASAATAETELSAGQGEVREASVLFTDIAGFTGISERLSPTELIEMLNEYFAVVSVPIEARGGVITQFQGDAILASFNLPQAVDDHAGCAIEAAQAIHALLRTRRFGAGLQLSTRIGINTGVVIGGLVGSEDRLGYTVHGDDVNLAARLEQLNKEHGTWITLSARTRECAGTDRFRYRALGSIQVRGRRQPTAVYTLDED